MTLKLQRNHLRVQCSPVLKEVSHRREDWPQADCKGGWLLGPFISIFKSLLWCHPWGRPSACNALCCVSDCQDPFCVDSLRPAFPSSLPELQIIWPFIYLPTIVFIENRWSQQVKGIIDLIHIQFQWLIWTGDWHWFSNVTLQWWYNSHVWVFLISPSNSPTPP